jgi:U3 small nucleolar RNA-associated protein 13
MCVSGLVLPSVAHGESVLRFACSYSPSSRYSLAARMSGHTEGVGTVAFARKSNAFVVSGSHDKTLKLWDTSFLAKWKRALPPPLLCLAVYLQLRKQRSARDTSFLTYACAESDGVQKPHARLAAVGHAKDINTAAVSPNDALVATGSADRLVKARFVLGSAAALTGCVVP